MVKQIGIIGAGMSGLLACKYILEKGLKPIVFEADEGVGGVWRHTIASTKTQNTRETFQFFDYPWPASVTEIRPNHTQVLEYLESYANHFGLLQHIKFHSKVVDIDYVGVSSEEMESWTLWSGGGQAFGSKGKWHVKVLNAISRKIEVYQVEFIILCLGMYSGFPNIPVLPPNEGPEIFDGVVMHSSDLSAMDDEKVKGLVKNKRVTIIGSKKTAIDIAAQCVNEDGTPYPCTIIQRTPHWLVPSDTFFHTCIAYLYLTRFSELFHHKPGESLLLSCLADVLSPIRWGISKLFESYLKRRHPLEKYGMVPKCSFSQDVSSCQISVIPDNFFERIQQGRIIIRNSEKFRFCKEGILISGDSRPIETDIVIYATGYRGDEKHRSIFQKLRFKNSIATQAGLLPLYRQVIHPRIPQLAVLGYAETFSVVFANEMRCYWLAEFMEGKFELPSISEMEKEVSSWEEFMRKRNSNSRRACSLNLSIWNHDQLCKEMNCQARRQGGFLNDLFLPYKPKYYANLKHCS